MLWNIWFILRPSRIHSPEWMTRVVYRCTKFFIVWYGFCFCYTSADGWRPFTSTREWVHWPHFESLLTGQSQNRTSAHTTMSADTRLHIYEKRRWESNHHYFFRNCRMVKKWKEAGWSILKKPIVFTASVERSSQIEIII